MTARAEAAAEELIGTCKALHEIATNGEEDDATFCARLDELAYECETCGWWHEAGDGQHDTGSGFNCEECHSDTDDRVETEEDDD